jgi:hypothetical protein
VRPTLTLTAVTKSLQKNWWLIALYVVFEFVGAGAGAALSGLCSFLVSLGFDVLTTIIGLYAVIKVVGRLTREA